jgi:hypothetical protein
MDIHNDKETLLSSVILILYLSSLVINLPWAIFQIKERILSGPLYIYIYIEREREREMFINITKHWTYQHLSIQIFEIGDNIHEPLLVFHHVKEERIYWSRLYQSIQLYATNLQLCTIYNTSTINKIARFTISFLSPSSTKR